MYHTPVLLNESIEGLRITKGGIYIDATFGGGGHSKELLNQLKGGKLFAFDKDPDAVDNIIQDQRFLLINADYRYIKNYLRLHEAIPCDGILADLGISSHQIDAPERGFSIRYDGDLDMRMDHRVETGATEVVNTYDARELADMFWKYGEIKNSYKLAESIIHARNHKKINTTTQLKEIAVGCSKRGQENKYLARVFQAIRIEVNKELEALEEFLEKSLEVLKPGGRMVVISYHSLEDRLVKNFFKSGNIKGIQEQDFYGNVKTDIHAVNRKPITAGDKELKQNPRARSAKLRIGEKNPV
ncbi:MAG: 16S rRNA (cytosine(1402)-N(4))-methyltransferase RsmH [Bacteroidota bacterium]